MARLVECRGCDRHVRADESRCPFCGERFAVEAPRRWLALVGWLPLVVGCSSETPPADGSATPARDAAERDVAPEPPRPKPDETPKPPEPAPTTAVKPEPTPPTPDEAADEEWGQQSVEPDLGATIEPPPEPEVERPMATKYGLPPRPPKKYGAPPRPAKKYGGPPRPDPDDPFGGL